MLAAALAAADERGVGALTMQAVADRLGVTSMALYRHVANKADLLDGLVESLLLEVPTPDPGAPPEQQLHDMAGSVRAVAKRHPEVFPLLLQRPATTPAAVTLRQLIYAALTRAGVPEDEVPRVERLLSTMVLGFAASEAGGRFSHCDPAEVDGDFAAFEFWVSSLLVSVLGPGSQLAGSQPTT